VAEERCAVGDLELCYERFGDPADPALLLVMGLATQMLGWHEDFCTALTDRGFHVIRFDNRDIGRSSRLTHLPPPTLRQLLRRDRNAAGYTLDDMADDTAGLLDQLGIERAHVAGASMGGMIAQSFAIRHPDRVLSLASIMSNTGGRWKGQPALRIYPLFLRRAPHGRDGYVEHTVRLFRTIGSPGFERDDDELREIAGRGYDRGVDAAGAARQLAAIVAASDRTAALEGLAVPAVVVHGSADPMINPSGGRATARAIPGARMVSIEGMGHDLPRGAWPQILDAITENAARAGEPAQAVSQE
jgi:pimeloyl-ACP methyl ester carboxylesterase